MKVVHFSIFLFLLSFASYAQKKGLSQFLRPYFVAPDSLKDDFGSFRSPLQFNDGRKVHNKEEWRLRRNEIKMDWEAYLGQWPAFDKEQQFKYLDSTVKENYTQYTVQFKWTPSEETIGYLLIPKNKKKSNAAVVTVFYEPETAIGIGKPKRDFALQLVKQNFIVLSIGTKEASAKQEFSIFYPSIDRVTVEPLSMLGYAANAAYYVLSNRSDVDKKRIGIVGHSFGGKWAMFASCLSDNFAAAVWSDPGIVMQEDRESVNYWEPWYLGFHAKPWRKRGLITSENPSYGTYNILKKEKRNLHELHALMAPRPFLVSGGSEDPVTQWRALNHTVAVNNLLGMKNKVAMSNRPLHDPNDESNDVIIKFFRYFLE